MKLVYISDDINVFKMAAAISKSAIFVTWPVSEHDSASRLSDDKSQRYSERTIFIWQPSAILNMQNVFCHVTILETKIYICTPNKFIEIGLSADDVTIKPFSK